MMLNPEGERGKAKFIMTLVGAYRKLLFKSIASSRIGSTLFCALPFFLGMILVFGYHPRTIIIDGTFSLLFGALAGARLRKDYVGFVELGDEQLEAISRYGKMFKRGQIPSKQGEYAGYTAYLGALQELSRRSSRSTKITVLSLMFLVAMLILFVLTIGFNVFAIAFACIILISFWGTLNARKTVKKIEELKSRMHSNKQNFIPVPAKPSPTKYYQSFQDVRKQLPTMWPIAVMFIVTVFYASGLKNQAVRTALLYMSLAYPAVILFTLSMAIPKLQYVQLDSEGIHSTLLGFIRRHIYWSDIESIGPAAIGGVEGIGLMYVGSFDRRKWGRKARRRMFGWDEVLANARAENGALLADGITKHFKSHLSQG